MLRLYRKTIFPRWHVSRKTANERKILKQPKVLVLCTSSQKENHSNHNDQKKQHADKKENQFWEDPQFKFNFFRTSMLETAGWLGTAALYFSCHIKHISSIFEYDKVNSSCIFSNIVLAMPKCLPPEESSLKRVPETISHNQKEQITNSTAILESIKDLTRQYVSAAQNSTGITNIYKNDKKAFHSFQNAARLGSIQGLYNLGLCYHLGKGTKVNLNMAAFCYRKAAMKGHGLASFNLATFFYKGIGGLPVDAKIAKELLAEAAEKGVPEARLYFGIEFLEEKRWHEAVRIFSDLAKKNLSEAQFYLGLCYENGLGVDKNKKLAVELFTKSAGQGNKRAMHKLQNCQADDMNCSVQSTVLKNMERSNSLHVSASVPELSSSVKKSIQTTANITISSYLDLTTPFLIVNNKDSKSKDNFIIGDDKVVKECSTTFLHFKSIPLVMQVKI